MQFGNSAIQIDEEQYHRILASPAGSVTLKTCTLNSRRGSPEDVRLSGTSCTNHVALDNRGVDDAIRIARDLAAANARHKVIYLSVWSDCVEDMVKMVGRIPGDLENLQVEWNMFCPNMAFEDNPSLGKHGAYLDALDNLPIPYGVKVPSMSEGAIQNLAELFAAHRVSFVKTINSIRGVSGSSIRTQSLRNIASWKKCLRGTHVSVIGTGGIMTDGDAYRARKAGADSVEMGTAYLNRGPKCFEISPEFFRDTVNILDKTPCVRRGTFTSKSGKKLDIYFDFRSLPSCPDVWSRVLVLAEQYARMMGPFDAVCGVATGALALSSSLAQILRVPHVYCRPEPKTHGTVTRYHGNFKKGRVLLVEDVATTGATVLDVKEYLESKGLEVIGPLSLLSRNPAIESVFVESDFKPVMSTEPYPYSEEMGVIVALDHFHDDQLGVLLGQIGNKASLLKVHMERFEGRPRLVSLVAGHCIRHRVRLFVDRKLSDIGSTMRMQVQRIYDVWPPELVQFITCHGMIGFDDLEAIRPALHAQTRFLMVCEMSTHASMSYVDYSAMRAAHLANCHDLVGGVVAQRKLTWSPSKVCVVPGIQMDESRGKTDGMGQQYRTIDQVRFADFVVMGRAITKASDPSEAVRKARKLCDRPYPRL